MPEREGTQKAPDGGGIFIVIIVICLVGGYFGLNYATKPYPKFELGDMVVSRMGGVKAQIVERKYKDRVWVYTARYVDGEKNGIPILKDSIMKEFELKIDGKAKAKAKKQWE